MGVVYMSIRPIKLVGNWDEGFALDNHVIESIYVGEDQYGRSEFDTTRSAIGELVYQLKYNNNTEVIYDIMELVKPFLEEWNMINKIDIVIPAPPSNKNRNYQPVFLISESVAKFLGKPIVFDLLEKINSGQIKNMDSSEKAKAISGSILKKKKFKKRVNILLVDDLYKSGTTLNEVYNVLKQDENVNNIYVLTMTKTRR